MQFHLFTGTTPEPLAGTPLSLHRESNFFSLIVSYFFTQASDYRVDAAGRKRWIFDSAQVDASIVVRGVRV